MTRGRAAGIAAALAGLIAVAWGASSAVQETAVDPAVVSPVTAPAPSADNAVATAPKPPAPAAAPSPPPVTKATPMAERVAVLGVLNKRNGIARDISLHPGQAARIGNLVVRLRACETTAAWEPEQLTGAFVQADLRSADGSWKRIFSGWLFKESPSLNVVENPLYDVWPKSCAMRHPEMGPDTVAASSPPPAPSSAKKSAPAADSAPADATPAGAAPSPSASSNSAT